MNVQVLYDSSKPFDQNKVNVLDEVMKAMKSGDGQKIVQASQVLEKLENDHGFWIHTDAIIKYSQLEGTKFFALMVLESTVKSKWDIIDQQNKTNLKHFVRQLMMALAKEDKYKKSPVLKKVNALIVEIIKKELGTTWQSAISDLITAAGTNQNVCQNVLHILRMLSEEVFEQSKNKLTSGQLKELKAKFVSQFESIYKLCDYVVKTYTNNNQSISIQLVKSSLVTLNSFLSWMPRNYIFSTDLLENILLKLMNVQYLTRDCIKCLTEVFSDSINNVEAQYVDVIKRKLLTSFNGFMEKLQIIIPRSKNLQMERKLLVSTKKGNDLAYFDGSIKELIIFFTGMYKQHFDWIMMFIGNCSNQQRLVLCQLLATSLHYMAIFSEIEEEDTFKLCMLFWNVFLKKYQFHCSDDQKKTGDQVLNLQDSSLTAARGFFKQIFVDESLTILMSSIVKKMPKPEEVVFVLDANDLPEKVLMGNTAHSEHYKTVESCLCIIAKMNFENLKGILNHQLSMIMSFTNLNQLNCLCWAIGTISGTANMRKEKKFLTNVLRNLLVMTDNYKKIEEKSVVASIIMYIVCKYPRFLKRNDQFLFCVFFKIFEFMKNKYDGVREMAVNTFSKLCENCNDKLLSMKTQPDQSTGNPGFKTETWEILSTVPAMTEKLSLPHKIVVYEGIGHLLGFIKDHKILTHCINHTLTPLMRSWKQLIGNGEANQSFLVDDETCRNISFFLRVNERLSSIIGTRFSDVFDHIFNDFVVLYKFYSQQITKTIQSNPNAVNFYGFKRMRAVRKDILKLFGTFLKTAEPQSACQKYFPKFGELLASYKNEVDTMKEAELILLYSEILNRMSAQVGEDAKYLLGGIIGSTLHLITKDFQSFPDHRVNFFIFLRAAVKNCFQHLINIEQSQFKTIIDCLTWSIKHSLSTIFEIGLETIQIVLDTINQNSAAANVFYRSFYMSFLHDILSVLTDKLHQNGFERQTEILRTLLLALDIISVPLLEGQQNNKVVIGRKILDLLGSQFSNLSQGDHQNCINAMFNSYKDKKQFQTALGDYLVLLDVYTNKNFFKK